MTATGRLRRLALLALVPVLVTVGVVLVRANGQSSSGQTSPLLGHRAPALSGPTLAGGHYAYRPGAVTVVNIWASWCAPCRTELPTLVRFAKQASERGVAVTTVDTRDGVGVAKRFLKRTAAADLTAVSDPDGVIAVGWGATGVPETFVVDAAGIVRAHWNGAVDEAWLRHEVARAGTAGTS